MEYSREVLEAVIQRLVEQLKRKESLAGAPVPGKRLLVLISGGMLGAEEAREQLKLLRADGHLMKTLFTRAGESVLGRGWLHEVNLDLPVLPVDCKEAPGSLLDECDVILVPVLTFNTAAKLACGIADNPVTTLLLQAMLCGKPIIAARDACDVNHQMYAGDGKNPSMVFRNRLKENIILLEQFGIRLVGASELRDAVCGEHRVECNALKQWPGQPVPLTVEHTCEVYTGSVVSVSTISQWPAKKMIIHGKTLITPAAKEAAGQRGIQIVSESQ